MTYTQGERYPIPQYSCIQLQNGQALRVGEYAMRRDGVIVRVDEFRPHGGYFCADGCHYDSFGIHRYKTRGFDLIAKVDNPKVEDTPKLWKDMTPEEKCALLLAYHERKVIEAFGVICPNRWYKTNPIWDNNCAYRIKPEQVQGYPKQWGEMDRNERYVLLLAKNEGRGTQRWDTATATWVWHNNKRPFLQLCAYRVTPEPKRETVVLYGPNGRVDPAIGTIVYIDGKPDRESLKIEC